MSMQRVLVISVVVNVVCLAALLWSLSKMQSLESRSILENKKKIVIDKSNLDRTKVAERSL